MSESHAYVFLDYESFSEIDLKKVGSYVYAEHPTTKVLCAAIRVNGHRIFWTLERFNLVMPPGVQYEFGWNFMYEMFSSNITVIAHNVDFERPMTTRCLKLPEPRGGWRDTMDQTLMRGLPAGADAAGQYLLGMGKDFEGYALMMKHCKPNKAGKVNPITDSVMQRYIQYNFRDVDIQFGISERFGVDIKPEWEQRVNDLHREVNDRGVQLDVPFATTLRSFDDAFKREARAQVEKVTLGEIKGTDLTRNDYVRAWLKTKGLELDNMRQDTIAQVIEADEEGEIELSTELYAVLTNRLVVTRAALSKVEAAIRGACADGRLRAILRYWGARTGRWAGMRFQPQNAKRPNEAFDEDSVEAFTRHGVSGGIKGISVLLLAIKAIEDNDIKTFEKCCIGLPPYELMSSLVRAILIPRSGCVFVAGDFSQIEARVLLWMAEDWENLKEHLDYDQGRGPDIYCKFASFLYRRNITKKDRTERQIGKIGELACGYQGGVGAVNRFAYSGGVDLIAAGIDPKTIVTAWREKHPLVVRMWHAVEDAFRRSMRSLGHEYIAGRCAFISFSDRTEVRLPSGRILTYMNTRLEPSRRAGWEDSTVIAYDSAVKGQVKHEEVYGGKLVENLDQAISRDLLADAMLRVKDTGDDIVLHVHDEQLVEVPEEYAVEAAASMKEIMQTCPAWGQGIPLNVKPDILKRYGK